MANCNLEGVPKILLVFFVVVNLKLIEDCNRWIGIFREMHRSLHLRHMLITMQMIHKK